MVAAIAPWFRLRLPSCGPGSNPKLTIYAFFNLYWNCKKRTKINKKRPRMAHFLKNIYVGLHHDYREVKKESWTNESFTNESSVRERQFCVMTLLGFSSLFDGLCKRSRNLPGLEASIFGIGFWRRFRQVVNGGCSLPTKDSMKRVIQQAAE